MRFDEGELFADDVRDDDAGNRRAFRRDEMIACEHCARANPPTRLNCLYCDATLSTPADGTDLRRPALKPLEEWERGFNVVLAPRSLDDVYLRPEALAETASLLRLKPAQLSEMLASGVALPLARTGVPEEIEFLKSRLGALNLKVEIVSDEELRLETAPPPRVRQIDFDEESSQFVSRGVRSLCSSRDASSNGGSRLRNV